MGTPSSIAVVYGNNEVRQIQCNSDGYPGHVGQYLLNHYNSLGLAVTLISHGNLSFIEKVSEPTTPMHSFETPEPGVCVYYGRDRGEGGQEFLKFNTLDEYFEGGYCEGYNYAYIDDQWYVIDMDNKTVTLLTQGFIDEVTKNGDDYHQQQPIYQEQYQTPVAEKYMNPKQVEMGRLE